MNWALTAAALLCGVAAVIHPAMLRRVYGPLIDSDLPLITRSVARLCFDGVTLLFVTLTALFALAAFGQVSRDAILFGGAQAAGVVVISVVFAIRAGKSPFKVPPVVILGAAAVLAFAGA